MPIPVTCPCGARFAAQDQLAGKTVKCPKCGGPLAIPTPTPLPADTGVAAILDEIGFQTAEGGAVVCPKCRTGLPPGQIECRACGYNLHTGGYRKVQAAPPAHAAAGYDWSRVQDGRRSSRRSSSYASDGGETLGISDVILCLCCPGIGCIYGGILMIQGNPKGWQIFALSCLMSVVGNFLRMGMREEFQPPPPPAVSPPRPVVAPP